MKKEVSPWRSGERKFSPGIRVPVLSVRDPRLLIAVTELSAYFPAGGGIFGVRLKSNRGAAGTDGGTGLFCFYTGLDPVDSGFSVSLFDFHKGKQAHPVRFVVPVFRLVRVHSGDHGFVFFCFVCAVIMPQVRIIEYIKQIFLQFVIYLIRFLFFPFGYFRMAYL